MYICIYIYVYIYTYMNICVNIYSYVEVNAYIYTYSLAHTTWRVISRNRSALFHLFHNLVSITRLSKTPLMPTASRVLVHAYICTYANMDTCIILSALLHFPDAPDDNWQWRVSYVYTYIYIWIHVISCQHYLTFPDANWQFYMYIHIYVYVYMNTWTYVLSCQRYLTLKNANYQLCMVYIRLYENLNIWKYVFSYKLSWILTLILPPLWLYVSWKIHMFISLNVRICRYVTASSVCKSVYMYVCICVYMYVCTYRYRHMHIRV